MRPLTTLVLLAALSPSLACAAPAVAEAPRPSPENLSLAQAERQAADLKQGMSVEDVQALLGRPRRTALKSSGSGAQGALQWTYNWTGSSSSQGSLRIDFASKTSNAWYVNSWEWSNY